jgi:hypothetical protein
MNAATAAPNNDVFHMDMISPCRTESRFQYLEIGSSCFMAHFRVKRIQFT